MQDQKRPRGRPKSLFKESSAGTLQSLDRALTILKHVARAEGLTLSDLARAVDVPTATTHRILITLQKHGFVTFNEERQEWMIGVEAYRTGAAFLTRNSMIEIGHPVMRRLMLETGETANLAVRDGAEVVFVDQVETQNPIRAFFSPGSRTVMYASGAGKAIMANMDEAVLDRLLKPVVLEGFTPNTHTSRESLRSDLSEIRARGWSFDREERHQGMSCIGAAIFNERGEPAAGISVSGPSARFAPDRIGELGDLVAGAAAEITALSGGTVPDSTEKKLVDYSAARFGSAQPRRGKWQV